MSYKQPQWVSPYTYLKILDNRDKHMSAAADPRKVRPLFIVAFTVDRIADGSRKIDKIKAHVVQGPGIVPPPRGSAPGNWSIELVDRHDRIIASHACRTPVALGGGCGCCEGAADIERAPHLDFVEAMEWSDEVTRIQIKRGDSQIASLDVGEAPNVEISGPERREGSLILNIRVHHPRCRPSIAVLFTGDDGETWSLVAIDPAQYDPFVVEPSRLPGGKSCRFRVVATAEFRAASADSNSFLLPRRDRELLIDVKEDHCESGRVNLAAMIDVRGHDGVAPHEIVWHSDIEGELGRGHMLSIYLEEGRHLLTATIPGDRHYHRGRTRAIRWTEQLRAVSASWTARRVFASGVDILNFGDVGEEEHAKPISKRGCISRMGAAPSHRRAHLATRSKTGDSRSRYKLGSELSYVSAFVRHAPARKWI